MGAGEGGRGTPIASPTRVQSGRYIFSVANCSHTEGELESRPVPTPTPGRRPRPAEPARALSRTALRRANLKVRPCPRRMRPRTKGGRRRGPQCREGWSWWKGWRLLATACCCPVRGEAAVCLGWRLICEQPAQQSLWRCSENTEVSLDTAPSQPPFSADSAHCICTPLRLLLLLICETASPQDGKD